MKTGTLKERDYKRGLQLKRLFKNPANKVITVTPMSYPEYFLPFIKRDDVLSIELVDSPENIFDRLVFSDENDCIYKDDEYKNAHKDYYLNDIQKDLEWYGLMNSEIENKIDVNNDSQEVVAERIISEFNLKPSFAMKLRIA